MTANQFHLRPAEEGIDFSRLDDLIEGITERKAAKLHQSICVASQIVDYHKSLSLASIG